VAVVALFACGKGNDMPAPAAPTSGGATAGTPPSSGSIAPSGKAPGTVAYTYCKNVCSRLQACKDFTYGDVGCVAGCQAGMNAANQRSQTAQYQCVLDGKSCQDYGACFASDSPIPEINFELTDDQLKASCAKFCAITAGTCKDRFEQVKDCVGDCQDDAKSSRTGLPQRILLLCTNVSQSCDEAVACNTITDTLSDRPAPTYSAPASPAAPSKAQCSNIGDKCVSDDDCCGDAARVRCWASHCKTR
jgi:hypothetical protein